MLRDLSLAYVIQDEVLLITTTEAAEQKLSTRIYPVADLVTIPGHEQEEVIGWPEFTWLEDVVRSTIQSATWDEVGGPGAIAELRNGKLLVVLQTQEVQDDVAGLLGACAKSRRRPAGKCPPPWTCPARPGRAEDRPRLEFAHEDRFQRHAVDRRDRAPESLSQDRDPVGPQGDGRRGHRPGQTAVTRKIKENSLDAALRQFLDEGTFTWIIDDESLLITTTDAAASRLYVTLYPVTDLVDRYRDEKGDVWADFDSLAGKIRTAVQPKSWDDAGGAGSLAHCMLGGTPVLVIAQTQQAQAEIAALLAKLRKAKPSGGRQQTLRPEQLPVKPRPAPAPRMEPPDNEGGPLPRGHGDGMFRCEPMPVPPVVQGGAGHGLGWTLALGIGLAVTGRRRRRKGASVSKAATAGLLAALLAAVAGSSSAETPKQDSPAPAVKPGAAEEKIEAVLDAPATLKFSDASLADVAYVVEQRYKIAVRLDKKAMEKAGTGRDGVVTRKLSGISLRSALRLMLGDLRLAYVVQDGALLITTPDAAATKLTTVTYPVADFVESARDAGGNAAPDFKPLIDVIRGVLSPTTLDEMGVPGSIAPRTSGDSKVLVISQTQDGHRKIAALLRELRAAKQLAAGGKEPHDPLYVPRRGPAEQKIEAALNSPRNLILQTFRWRA